MAKDKNLYAVILAGGAGTRFWPLSRRSQPKQFLNIHGEKSLFQQTLLRLRPKIDGTNIIIVTNKAYTDKIRQQIKGFKIPPGNILPEPEGKNTAPAVCWAASVIHQRNPKAVMAVLPSDHLITQPREYLSTLQKAVDLAQTQHLVVFGITPSRPETGYGYFKTHSILEGKRSVLKVIKFIEKPSFDRAMKFLQEGNYYWNSGMFVWKTEVILSELKRYQPAIYELLSVKNLAKIKNVWKKLPSISIDCAILEKSHRVAAVAAKNIGWSDVGSWQSLAEVSERDERKNIFKGDVLDIGSQNTFVWSSARLVATVGLQDMVIVDTPDALLVCRMDQCQKVKEIVGLLNKGKRKEV